MASYVAIEISDAKDIKTIKDELEANGILNKKKKITSCDGHFTIFTKCSDEADLEKLPLKNFLVKRYEEIKEGETSLYEVVESFMRRLGLDAEQRESLLTIVPKRWSLYPPMVLFGSGTFDSELWERSLGSKTAVELLFKEIISKQVFATEVTHLAINKPIIETDTMRRPLNIMPLIGDFGPPPTHESFDDPSDASLGSAFWCSVVQNGIYQTWAPLYTMFSRGNIKEKKRILDSFPSLQNSYIFDLYAGIGYFTLSYLKNGGTLFCWEINPWSVEGLKRNVTANGYKYAFIQHHDMIDRESFQLALLENIRVFIFFESNEYAYERYLSLGTPLPISHINLGLLPTSESAWPILRKLAQASSISTMIHVHENVHLDNFITMRQKVSTFFAATATAMFKVKTFAPDIWHTVIDVLV